jgi:hypothetical protein
MRFRWSLHPLRTQVLHRAFTDQKCRASQHGSGQLLHRLKKSSNRSKRMFYGNDTSRRMQRQQSAMRNSLQSQVTNGRAAWWDLNRSQVRFKCQGQGLRLHFRFQGKDLMLWSWTILTRLLLSSICPIQLPTDRTTRSSIIQVLQSSLSHSSQKKPSLSKIQRSHILS